MKVRIVCYENLDGWILGKFATKLNSALQSIGIDSDIGNTPDNTADINHHIIYLDFSRRSTLDTVMVTHVDFVNKLKLLRDKVDAFEMAICMSSDTMQKLIGFGLPKEKVNYVNPAHDETHKAKKLSVGIFSNVYEDHRKNENIIVDLSKKIDPTIFSYTIMGSGWEGIRKQLSSLNFDVSYYSKFDKDLYNKLIYEIDYLLYVGNDEGSMSVLDALAAGKSTIVSKQGFHLDLNDGIEHFFNSLSELEIIFLDIEKKIKKRTAAVFAWTWKDYALEHIYLWNQILNKNQLRNKTFDISKEKFRRINKKEKTSKYSNLKIFKHIVILVKNSLLRRIRLG